MFPVINQIANDRNLAPGTYDLLDFVPKRNDKHSSLTSRISNYTTDMRSADYPLRALVFGNESAKISGRVEVNPDGSKTFKQIEIRPLDTDFDFEHNTWNPLVEGSRELARQKYDPENRGVSYYIQYRGPGPDHPTGRIYDPFTDSQLNAALRKEFVYPNSGSPGLLPSITGKAPLPYANEHLQYVDQASGNNPQPAVPTVGAPATRFVSPAKRGPSSNNMADWIASLAGVDPASPTQPAPQPADGLRGIWSNEPTDKWFVQPSIPFPF